MALNIKVLQCEKCNGEIVPLEKHSNNIVFGKCAFCGTPYALSEEHAPRTQSDYIETNYDIKIRNGYEWMHVHKDYESAINVFKKAIDEKVEDYRGFWGLVNALSKEFTDIAVNKSVFCDIQASFHKTIKAVQAHESKVVENQLQSIWDDYVKRVKNYWHSKEIEITRIKTNLSDTTKLLNNARQKLNYMERQISNSITEKYEIKEKKSFNTFGMYMSYGLLSVMIICGILYIIKAAFGMLIFIILVFLSIALILFINTIRLKIKYSRLNDDINQKSILIAELRDSYNNKYQEKDRLEKSLNELQKDVNEMKQYLYY